MKESFIKITYDPRAHAYRVLRYLYMDIDGEVFRVNSMNMLFDSREDFEKMVDEVRTAWNERGSQ